MADLYIYPNTVRAVLLDGAQVREWLEMSAGQFNMIDPSKAGDQPLINTDFPTYNYDVIDVIDGVGYQVDVTKPVRYSSEGKVVAPDGHRIVNLTFNGKPIDEAQKFVVATNNYRAGGGGKFPGLDGSTIILEAPDENRTVLAHYILELKQVNQKADDNWSFAPISGNPSVTFTSSPKATKAVEAGMGFKPDGLTEDGFAKFKLTVQ